MTNRIPLSLLMVLVCVLFSGCSEDGPPPLDVYPVTGTLRLDGKPVGGVSIAFVPEGEGGGGFATSDDEGKFSLKSNDQRDGVQAGMYCVLFTKITMPDGSPIPEGEMAADVGAENSLPAIYNDPERTSVKAEVKAGENAPLEFDLKSTP